MWTEISETLDALLARLDLIEKRDPAEMLRKARAAGDLQAVKWWTTVATNKKTKEYNTGGPNRVATQVAREKAAELTDPLQKKTQSIYDKAYGNGSYKRLNKKTKRFLDRNNKPRQDFSRAPPTSKKRRRNTDED